MTEMIFAFDENNYRRCQEAFRGTSRQDYYLGDYVIEPAPVIDVRAEKKAVGPCSIVRMRARTLQSFRREWSHIHADGADVTILWFVRSGELHVSHESGRCVAGPGDFMTTRSNKPFLVECHPDETGLHEVLHVVVPVEAALGLQHVNTGFSVKAGNRGFRIVERLLTEIFEDDGDLTDPVARSLLDCALGVLVEAVGSHQAERPTRQSLIDQRLQEVLQFIERHFTDPNLSLRAVAGGCGISVRYVCYLLKQNGTSFADLVWTKRLEAASRWLLRSPADEALVAEICYRVGFKSAPHFSRMFKRMYGMTPGEYRESAATANNAN